MVESDMRSRMQTLRDQLASTISHLHTLFESHVFIAICRGYWDRMGQVCFTNLWNLSPHIDSKVQANNGILFVGFISLTGNFEFLGEQKRE